MSTADQSIIDLTNETAEEIQNGTHDDVEIVGQNIKCGDNDEPIYCKTNKRRRSSNSAPDVLEIADSPPSQRPRVSSNRRPGPPRQNGVVLDDAERPPESLPVTVPVEELGDAEMKTPTKLQANLPNMPLAALAPPVISPGFECPICLEKHKDNLVSTICGHIFCKPCLKESMKNVKQCPKCRKKITVKSFHNIFI